MAAATTFGTIGEFVPGSDAPWSLHLERLEFYCIANDLQTAEKKRAVLCTVCVAATHAVIRSPPSPALPSETSYEDIVSKLTAQFNPMPSDIVPQFQFGKRDQRPSESIADYIAELRRLSEHCDFGFTLDDKVRNRLTYGLREKSLQRIPRDLR
ncbi:hypothetical protein HPB47_016434 [Ixodes persulcatus]|uniref:Uncharacterized protein n=1 Tax=Ixodes persulcatus TaxID=34615 RepID=A0AC60QUK6_IXOPE|nr:hypothetical protein HPB47_016434 [Ixodes persulcatus]